MWMLWNIWTNIIKFIFKRISIRANDIGHELHEVTSLVPSSMSIYIEVESEGNKRKPPIESWVKCNIGWGLVIK